MCKCTCEFECTCMCICPRYHSIGTGTSRSRYFVTLQKYHYRESPGNNMDPRAFACAHVSTHAHLHLHLRLHLSASASVSTCVFVSLFCVPMYVQNKILSIFRFVYMSQFCLCIERHERGSFQSISHSVHPSFGLLVCLSVWEI